MGGYFWGCAPKIFSQVWTNVETFQKKKTEAIDFKLVELQCLLSKYFFCPSTVVQNYKGFTKQQKIPMR